MLWRSDEHDRPLMCVSMTEFGGGYNEIEQNWMVGAVKDKRTGTCEREARRNIEM
jgi:hypothetical protein